MNIAEQLRNYRLNTLAKIVPAGVMVPVHRCPTCGGPAGELHGRHSQRMFVVPMGCGHHPHPVGEEARAFFGPVPPLEFFVALLNQHTDRHAAFAASLERQKDPRLKLRLIPVVKAKRKALQAA